MGGYLLLSTILRNRKSQNKSTFLAFLDAENAFDRIDRDLLLYKLLLNGVKGNTIHDSIKANTKNRFAQSTLIIC